MVSQVVADSGIFMAAVLEETFSEEADQLIQEWNQHKVQISAPMLFQYEIIAVIRKHVYRELLTTDEAAVKRDILLTLAQGIRFELDEGLLRRAYELAGQLKRPTAYASHYLALAERRVCSI